MQVYCTTGGDSKHWQVEAELKKHVSKIKDLCRLKCRYIETRQLTFSICRLYRNLWFECVQFTSQMTSSDKDFRFMATNDLMTELQKDSIKLDDDSERKVRIMKQLLIISLQLLPTVPFLPFLDGCYSTYTMPVTSMIVSKVQFLFHIGFTIDFKWNKLNSDLLQISQNAL